MNEIKHEYTASINLTRILLKYASGKGIYINEIFHNIGISSSTLENPGKRISAEIFNSIWRAITQKLKDKDFGLHLGESGLSYPAGNMLISIMMNSPTVESAIHKYCRYHNLMADMVIPEVFQSGEMTYLRWKTISPERKLHRHHAEAILSMFCSILSNITDEKFKIRKVHLAHPKPPDISEHKRIFCSSILFNQPNNELVFESKQLCSPIFLANHELLIAFEQFAQKSIEKLTTPNTWAYKVVHLLNKILLSGTKPSIGLIANSLTVCTRNLQIKLKEEKTTYQQLLDQVRKEIALNYIRKTGVTIWDITFLLGFSEQSVFNHSFKRWTGYSPGEYRKNRKNN